MSCYFAAGNINVGFIPIYDGQGAQVPGFDELTHSTKSQFFYMMSRNRSMCGVRPYIRATCNPDADSWVAEFISWWIDQETGLPIPERAGKVRYLSASMMRLFGEIGEWCRFSVANHKPTTNFAMRLAVLSTVGATSLTVFAAEIKPSADICNMLFFRCSTGLLACMVAD